jgi:hypothetical protein
MSNKPTYTRRLNRVEVAIWKNETEDAIWHNVTFQRTYRDEKGEMQNTNNFRMDDLPALAFLAAKAYDQMASTDE